MNNELSKQIFLSAKDVMTMLNKGLSTAQKKLQAVRKHYNLKPYSDVDIYKFCEYHNLNLDLALHAINSNHKLPDIKKLEPENQLKIFDDV